jgi:hypothetical protein
MACVIVTRALNSGIVALLVSFWGCAVALFVISACGTIGYKMKPMVIIIGANVHVPVTKLPNAAASHLLNAAHRFGRTRHRRCKGRGFRR